MEDKRIDNQYQFCPLHDKLYRCREDDRIICLTYECGWTSPARRSIDQHIPSVSELKSSLDGGLNKEGR